MPPASSRQPPNKTLLSSEMQSGRRSRQAVLTPAVSGAPDPPAEGILPAQSSVSGAAEGVSVEKQITPDKAKSQSLGSGAAAKAGGGDPDWSAVAAGSCCWWGSGVWSVVLCINVIVTPRSRNSCCVTEPGALAGRGRGRGCRIRTLLFLVSPNLSRLLVPLFLGTLPPIFFQTGRR